MTTTTTTTTTTTSDVPVSPDNTRKMDGSAPPDTDIEAVVVGTETTTSPPPPAEENFVEPYMPTEAIAQLHPASHIDIWNVEQSRGLASDEVFKRWNMHGKNVLTPPRQKPEWKRFVEQFQNLFLILLIGSAGLSIVAYLVLGDETNLYLAIVLIVVVFLTGLLQFHEEGKANKVADSFNKLLATSCVAIRDGHQKKINVQELVPGDLVYVKNGDKVPADMVLLFCRGLKVECSSLTGESEPVSCTDTQGRVLLSDWRVGASFLY